ncbi:MAG: MATE family efflux transporter [Eubacteriales bacterium]|nr:MATE family efflux transporter [Eubacteriales bacterium]
MKQGASDMTEGVIWKQLISFAIPMAIGLLFQQLYNTVDTIVVGRFVGKEALAAVGSTSSIVNMLVGLFAGISTGASVVISQCYGAHEYKELHDAVHTTISFTLLMSVLATGLGILLVDPMLRMMSTPEDVFGEAQRYLNIYFGGMSGLMIYNMGSGILRAVGDSRRPLYFLCFSAIINTILDLLFVIVFHMGVEGVAYATIISQFLSAVLVLFVLTRDHAPYGIRWKDLCLKLTMFKRILSIGLPSGIQQAITSFSNVFVQSYINFFGSACMAGWSGYNKLDVFLLIPMQSIALASTTFVGQNFGAKKLKRARDGIKQSLIMAVSVTILLSGLLILCARPMMLLFSTDEEVLRYGVYFITMISPFYFTMCFNQVFGGALRGVGQANKPMLIMLFSFVVLRQLYLYANRVLFNNSFTVLTFAYPVGWIACSILLSIYYKKSVLCRKDAQ